jgi:predicted SprT family Zn-dependent metalloprotease
MGIGLQELPCRLPVGDTADKLSALHFHAHRHCRRRRSADWQSAVSQVGNLRTCETIDAFKFSTRKYKKTGV